MKIGFILECGLNGADLQVCKLLVSRIDSNIEFIGVTLDNKPKLINGCGVAAKQLFKDGCDKVFIIWDLYPNWRTDNSKPCRKEDRDNIFSSLNAAEVPPGNVNLVCIEQELEAWLLADGRAISAFLSKPTKTVSIDHEKNPDQVNNPKKKLNQHFTQNRGNSFNYIDYMHAEKLIRLTPDFTKLRRSESFKRFYLKLTGNPL